MKTYYSYDILDSIFLHDAYHYLQETFKDKPDVYKKFINMIKIDSDNIFFRGYNLTQSIIVYYLPFNSIFDEGFTDDIYNQYLSGCISALKDEKRTKENVLYLSYDEIRLCSKSELIFELEKEFKK